MRKYTMIRITTFILTVLITLETSAQQSLYQTNLGLACDLFNSKSELPDSILLKLVPVSYEEFDLLYGTTAPDNRMNHTGFFYTVTQQIFDKLLKEHKGEFYLPCLQLGSFADGEFGEAFIENLDIIIPRDKDRFCAAVLGQEFLSRNPIRYYYKKYCDTSFQDKLTFQIKAKWKKGEAKQMIIRKSGSWINYGTENTFPYDTTGRYSITIVEKNEKGYTIVWKVIYDFEIPEEYGYMMDYISQYKFIIQTDANGSFLELMNWKELLKLNKELKKNFYSLARKENINQAEADNMMAQRNLPETKEVLLEECNFLSGIFLAIYGKEVTLNDTVSEQTTIPNPNINEEIPATLQTITKRTDNERISITYAYLFDQVKLKELKQKYFPDQEYSEERMDTSTEYIYNQQNGWLEKISTLVEFEGKDSKSTTIIEYIIR